MGVFKYHIRNCTSYHWQRKSDLPGISSCHVICLLQSMLYTLQTQNTRTILTSALITLLLLTMLHIISEKRVLPNLRVYFANHKSKTTQWEDPRRSMVEQLPLPCGWEIRYTENNKKYFIDHNTRTTTFEGK